VNDKLK